MDKINRESMTPEELERNEEKRKGICSFLNVMIALCPIAVGILSVFIAFPLPKEMLDRKTTFFLA